MAIGFGIAFSLHVFTYGPEKRFDQTQNALLELAFQDDEKLSTQLKNESVEKLAADARDKGNAIKGAILFAQQKTNCVKCHASGQSDLLGPDLNQLDKREATDVYLVESILLPSKVIKKGFGAVTVLTTSGQTISGRVISQDSETLVLRDSADSGNLITLKQSEIEQTAENKVSSMPEDVVEQLSKRQDFLDIVKYMIELVEAGQTPSTNRTPQPIVSGQKIDDKLRGLALVKQFNCIACHEDNTHQISVTNVRTGFAPNLTLASSRIDPHYIEEFIADPLHVKPKTTMPDVLHALDAVDRRAAAQAITQFLVSLQNKKFARQNIVAAEALEGDEIFHRVGCVACHPSVNKPDSQLLAESSVPFGDIANKYNLDGLTAFLEDPLAVRPAGRMPSMALDHWEARSIAQFLLQDRPNDSTEPFIANASLVAEGKLQFSKMGCASCHQTADEATNEPIAYRNSKSILQLSNSSNEKGCLSEQAGDWPMFDFDPEQRTLLRSALRDVSKTLNADERVLLSLETFNCVACHASNQYGGIAPERIDYFKTTNENIGPQGRIPPTLTNVGAKLNQKWLRDVLVNGRAIRPYLMTRMPQFGTENVEQLVGLFGETAVVPDVAFANFNDMEEARKTGHQMVGNGGLNCVACHTFQNMPGETMAAVDLTEMAERLRKEWFYDYMLDPQRYSPNTVMPSFWPGGHSMRRDILDGKVDFQLEALWQYLLEDRQARTPQGLINEPIELIATNEAVMLRRSYDGIGKRGIGVGYPGQVNLAFDAEQMRLAMIWEGRFAETSGVWKGQGSGTVRPLGNNIIRFNGGPDLDDATNPWLVDLPEAIAKLEQPNASDVKIRPPKHQFKGYVLDDLQRPTFQYEFDGIEVEDKFIDLKDRESGRSFFHRTLKLTSEEGRANTCFRVATGDTIETDPDGSFRIGQHLHVRILGKNTTEISETKNGKQLLILLDVEPGTTTLELDYRW